MIPTDLPGLDALIGALQKAHTMEAKRIAIAKMQAYASTSERAREVLAGCLSDEELRYDIRAVLAGMGDLVLPSLRKVLLSSDAGAKTFACHVVSDIGPPAAAAIPEVLPCFLQGPEFLHDAAGDALTSIGPAAIPAFVEALRDGRSSAAGNREYAAMAIGEVCSADEDAIRALENAFDDEEEGVRLAARESILLIHGEHPDAVSQALLEKAMGDETRSAPGEAPADIP